MGKDMSYMTLDEKHAESLGIRCGDSDQEDVI